MTFIEFLETLPPDEWIYVGMENGSSFVLIEPAEVLLNKMSRANIMVREITRKSASYARKRIRVIENYIPRQKNYIENMKKKKPESFARKEDEPGIDYEQLKKLCISNAREDLIKNQEELQRKTEYLVWAENYLENYVPLPKRQVMDSRKRLSKAECGTIVIIEGFEHGSAWFLAEIMERL